MISLVISGLVGFCLISIVCLGFIKRARKYEQFRGYQERYIGADHGLPCTSVIYFGDDLVEEIVKQKYVMNPINGEKIFWDDVRHVNEKEPYCKIISMFEYGCSDLDKITRSIVYLPLEECNALIRKKLDLP
ncbi:hypothetical protein C0583_05200 [Candidatus Parcubacteria bacterium]|nr:MAG: hypothetical protein C0583_05200 [Candidatus Parcubacteria bacterium]